MKRETYPKLKKELTCSHCNKGFVTKDILTVHNIVAHSKLQIKLKRVDNLVAKYQPSVNRNLESIHKRKKPWKCQLCPSSFPVKIQLKNHVKWVHDKIKTEKCSICEVTFARKGDLNNHYKKVHFDEGEFELNFGPSATLKKQKEVKPYVCNICDGKFSAPNQLKKHVEKDHERKKKKQYQCTNCEASFICKVSLFTHIAAVHERIKSHKCSFCDASFGQSGSLNRHIKEIHEKLKRGHVEGGHEGKKKKVQKIVHEEKERNTGFKRKSGLSEHKSVVREGKKKKLQKNLHEEKELSTGFKSKPGLHEDKSVVHEGKKHGCSICGANLSGKSSVGLHIRSVGVVQVCAEHGL